jgi:hypothetical protein
MNSLGSTIPAETVLVNKNVFIHVFWRYTKEIKTSLAQLAFVVKPSDFTYIWE